MKRSSAVHLSLVLSVTAFLSSCEERNTRYCVDDNQKVTDDWNCEDKRDIRHHWYYTRGFHGVANGTRLYGGSFVAPSSGFATRSSASIRGGIGAAGEAAAGHGSHASGGGGE